MKKWRPGITLAVTVLAVLALGLFVAACGGDSSTGGSSSSPAAEGGTVVGAGASFPAPLYSKWGQEYNAVSGTKLNYQSIGSGGGISAIEAGTVDFGASDAPLEEADLEANGLAQFPMVVGGVVPVVNLEGISSNQLKFTADVLAGIFMGEITTWNDPAITDLNPGAKLPSTKINVVHRSDGSGTTWIFTNYLTAAAGDVWTAGADKEIDWPVGVGGKGNEGVSASVQQLTGSIGYVEYAYAKQTGLTTTQLQNKDGKWVDRYPRFVRGRHSQRRLGGLAAEHVPGPRRPAGRHHVANHRRFVHPGAEGTGGRRAGEGDVRLLRLVLRERRRERLESRLRAAALFRLRHRRTAGVAHRHRRRLAGLAVTRPQG